MTKIEKLFTPSQPLEPGDRYGVLSGFDPGTRTLAAGFRLAPAFKTLPVDIVLDKDVSVTMRDGKTTYVGLHEVPPRRPLAHTAHRGARGGDGRDVRHGI